MLNQTELAEWAKKTLATNALDFIDEEDDKISYEVGGDHEAFAADVFSVDDCSVQIRDGEKVLGGILFVNEYNQQRQCTVTEAANYNVSIQEMIPNSIHY